MDFQPKIEEKRWELSRERELSSGWESLCTYSFDKNTKKPIWTLDTPPPYASGGWHVGGAAHYSQIDMIARYKRMSGFEVIFPMTVDRNGLPIEVQTEKEFKVRMFEVGRQKFLDMCRQLLDKYEHQILEICRALGFSMNSLKEINRTDSPKYRAITQSTFIELWKRGLIYEDSRPNNWCPDCGTTIADAEVEYKEIDTWLATLKFPLVEATGHLEIATTRPELICACAAILVHPDDERYKNLTGKHVKTPLFGKEVPILSHPAAKADFGTGAMMVCSYGDYTDVRLFRELGLTPTAAIDQYGKMTASAGKYEGLRVKKARAAAIEDLESEGALIKKTKLPHRTPICWRSKTPVEFVQMPEFYLKQIDFLPRIRELAREIKFHPPSSRQMFDDWAASVSMDWPISRRRFYGTEIPIWHCKNCGEKIIPEPGKYYRPWTDESPVNRCGKCGSSELVGEERTFDTWMDSSISELYHTYYRQDDKIFQKAFPCSIRPQGKDIVRTWLFYTILRAAQLFDKPAFRNVWISGHIVDEKGNKMSKSVGNVVKPEPIIAKYGADALRFSTAIEASLGSDIRFSEEKVGGASKFVQKVFNVTRFISCFPQAKKPSKLEPADEWILSELSKATADSIEGYEAFDFFVPSSRVRRFLWELFASHYIELVKERAYNKENRFTKEAQQSAWYTLHKCARTCLLLLAPITPFVTEHLWKKLYSSKSIHLEQIPKHEKTNEKLLELTKPISEFNASVWKHKKDSKLSMKDALERFEAPKALELLEKDLLAMHNLGKIEWK